jgi:hypothetical protein
VAGPYQGPNRRSRIPITPTMIVDLAVEQGAGHHETLYLIGSLVELGDLSSG